MFHSVPFGTFCYMNCTGMDYILRIRYMLTSAHTDGRGHRPVLPGTGKGRASVRGTWGVADWGPPDHWSLRLLKEESPSWASFSFPVTAQRPLTAFS